MWPHEYMRFATLVAPQLGSANSLNALKTSSR
jgi:hypothetical protein